MEKIAENEIISCRIAQTHSVGKSSQKYCSRKSQRPGMRGGDTVVFHITGILAV